MRVDVRMISGEYSRDKIGFTYTEVGAGTYSVLPSISEQRRINIPFSHQTLIDRLKTEAESTGLDGRGLKIEHSGVVAGRVQRRDVWFLETRKNMDI